MIAVIDTASSVRHACFNALTEMGYPVVVFYSPDTFINSGAIYSASVLVLGETRVGRTRSEALLWASVVRPDLHTLLLGPGEIQLIHLCELFETDAAATARVNVAQMETSATIEQRINLDFGNSRARGAESACQVLTELQVGLKYVRPNMAPAIMTSAGGLERDERMKWGCVQSCYIRPVTTAAIDVTVLSYVESRSIARVAAAPIAPDEVCASPMSHVWPLLHHQ